MTYPDKDKLIQLCKSVVKNKKYNSRKSKKNNIITYCNQAVAWIALLYVKYTLFKGLYANEISDIMIGNTFEWKSASMGKAYHYCNEGYFVIGHVKKKTHGHVVVLTPGSKVNSKKWQRWVPRCVNIGKKNWIDRGINFAFTSEPMFHIYDPDDSIV